MTEISALKITGFARRLGVALGWQFLLAAACIFSVSHDASAEELKASAGIGGRARVGLWTECRLSAPVAGATKIVVQTQDGDGSPVRYESPIAAGNSPRCSFQLGPDSGPITITVQDTGGAAIDQVLVQAPSPVPFNQKWILAIGNSLGIEAASDEQGRRNFPIVHETSEIGELPNEWIGYDGLDLVMIAGSQLSLMKDLNEDQRNAFGDWVKQGGRVILTLGGRSQQPLADADWITNQLGIAVGTDVVQLEPTQVETATKTQDPLEPFDAIRMPIEGGTNLLVGRYANQSIPIVKEYLVGFGRVLVVCADLDRDPFTSWDDRQTLLDKYMPGVFGAVSMQGTSRRRADVGYDDMAGQLRKTLDSFSSRWRIPFKWIACFVALFLIAIGPLDFFIVNVWQRRPQLGWFTYPAIVLLFGGFALWASRMIVPKASTFNQIAILDVNPAQKVGRSFVWSQFMSNRAVKANFQYEVSRPLEADSTKAQATVGWWGAAGSEFGGLSTTAAQGISEYSISLAQQFDSGSANQGVDSGGTVRGASQLPLAVAATKGLASRFLFEPNATARQELFKRPGQTDLLVGRVTNPLPYALHDGILVYRDSVYQLPTVLGPGRRSSEVSLIKYRNLRIRLTRRKIGKGNSSSEDWNPEMDDDVDRLLQIMMMYESAGGLAYTNLKHRVMQGIDLSYILDTDHAILMGRIDDPVIQLSGDAEVNEAEAEINRCYVRVLLPVENQKKSNPRN